MLNRIVLSQISRPQFAEFRTGWYGSPGEKGTMVPIEIRKPMQAPSYRNILEQFMDSPHADVVSVNDRGKWRQYRWRNILPEDIKEICRIASEDGRKLGHLELYFDKQPNGYRRKQFRDLVKIKCAEVDEQVVGYEIMMCPAHARLFTWQSRPENPSKHFGGYVGLLNPLARLAIAV